jgi:hypothetical protein
MRLVPALRDDVANHRRHGTPTQLGLPCGVVMHQGDDGGVEFFEFGRTRYMQVEVMAELVAAAGTADPRQIPCAA